MEDQILRLEALRLAAGFSENADDALEIAQRLYDFLRNQAPPAPTISRAA
jgi:hypothetical protein